MTLVFELKSILQTKKLNIISDHFELTSLQVEEGQELRVLVRDEEGGLVAQNTFVFKPIRETARMQDYHAISICNEEIEANF